MNVPTVKVFNQETVLRLGLQNRVLRKLRDMGCKVRAASLDSMLTIAIEPSKDMLRHRIPGGFSMRTTGDGRVVTIDVEGCRVWWTEGQKQ